MAISLDNILKWWRTNLRPTEAQIKTTFEAFRHKGDFIPVGEIEGIDELISDKADNDRLTSHINDDGKHITAEFLASMRTVVEVFGNPFFLVKHPLNNDPSKSNTIQANDFIVYGFRDGRTFWLRAVYTNPDPNSDINDVSNWKVLDYLPNLIDYTEE